MVLHIIQQFVFCGLKCVNVRILMKVGIKNFINKTVFTKDFLKAPCTVCVIVPGQIKVNPATKCIVFVFFCEFFLKNLYNISVFLPEKLQGKKNIVIVLCELLQYFSIC